MDCHHPSSSNLPPPPTALQHRDLAKKCKWTQTLFQRWMTDEFMKNGWSTKKRRNETKAAIHTDTWIKQCTFKLINVHQYHTLAPTHTNECLGTQLRVSKARVSSINTEWTYTLSSGNKKRPPMKLRERDNYFIQEHGWEHKKKPKGSKGGELRRNVKKGYYYKGDACVKGLKAGVTTSKGWKDMVRSKREAEGILITQRVIICP